MLVDRNEAFLQSATGALRITGSCDQILDADGCAFGALDGGPFPSAFALFEAGGNKIITEFAHGRSPCCRRDCRAVARRKRTRVSARFEVANSEFRSRPGDPRGTIPGSDDQ